MATGGDGGKVTRTLLDFDFVEKRKFSEEQDENDRAIDRGKTCLMFCVASPYSFDNSSYSKIFWQSCKAADATEVSHGSGDKWYIMFDNDCIARVVYEVILNWKPFRVIYHILSLTVRTVNLTSSPTKATACTYSFVLSQILLQAIECLADSRWELRRMAQQVVEATEDNSYSNCE